MPAAGCEENGGANQWPTWIQEQDSQLQVGQADVGHLSVSLSKNKRDTNFKIHKHAATRCPGFQTTILWRRTTTQPTQATIIGLGWFFSPLVCSINTGVLSSLKRRWECWRTMRTYFTITRWLWPHLWNYQHYYPGWLPIQRDIRHDYWAAQRSIC